MGQSRVFAKQKASVGLYYSTGKNISRHSFDAPQGQTPAVFTDLFEVVELLAGRRIDQISISGKLGTAANLQLKLRPVGSKAKSGAGVIDLHSGTLNFGANVADSFTIIPELDAECLSQPMELIVDGSADIDIEEPSKGEFLRVKVDLAQI